MWIIILNADCFSKDSRKVLGTCLFFSPPTSDSDANGHRPHCKAPLFYTRSGFIQAINHTFANLENFSEVVILVV